MGQSIDKRQLLWGGIAGVITVGLMAAAYFVGVNVGENKEEEVLGEAVEVVGKEIYIKVASSCEEYKTGSTSEGGKEVHKYCVVLEEGKSAFDVMKKLEEEDEKFSFSYDESEFGVFITSINNYHPDVADKFWAFLVNGEMSMVGAGDYQVNDGDELGFQVEEVTF